MKRMTCEERPNWTDLVNRQGLVYTRDTDPSDPFHKYWGEGVYYSFTLAEIDALDEAAKTVFDMCVEAGDWMALPEQRDLLVKIGIPEWAHKHVLGTWNQEPEYGSVYGRFDFRFGGLDHPDPEMRIPKVYEFNADTPTSLLESATIQWEWLKQTGHGRDQWNLVYEQLVHAWTRNLRLIENHVGLTKPTVHFAIADEQGSFEDEMNTLLIRDSCVEAGWSTKTIFMEKIKLGEDGRFYDEEGEHIDVIFKLYPWEHMVNQDFGRAAFEDMDNIGKHDDDGNYIGGTTWIEPPYKMLWSNKALMAVLWKLFKDDERAKYLIPTFFEEEAPVMERGYARKPLLSREGANISLVDSNGTELVEIIDREYGEEGFVLQELALPPVFVADGEAAKHPVLGIWMIDGETAGMGIRESVSPVTDDFANFIPHSIADGERRYRIEDVPVIELQDSVA